MATTRVIMVACAVLFFLILCREAVRVEGRPLKSELCRKCSTNNDNSVNVPENGNHGLADGQEKTSKVNYVEDFRPTEPGHSPGVNWSLRQQLNFQLLFLIDHRCPNCSGLKS
ncbi:hypothetical protein OIU77_003304 [Salix suchowensis]|uniref:Uncharacterized protein n=1 Tax=Salix suchowensis TaxID=1278906 RepID=A0ABQ9AZ92_9ROSI|nr:hypothetical protein OIU77_003304 [Salix suchowensis]